MTAIRVFEPALCCNTGVCGPDVDQALVRFTADLKHLQGLGADIARHNLANDPQAFATNDTVRAFLQVAGSDGLPLTLVDGITVAAGAYPDRTHLLRYAGLTDQATTDKAANETNDGQTPAVVPRGAATLAVTDASVKSCSASSGCC
jgi:arsenite-transporting ATPase